MLLLIARKTVVLQESDVRVYRATGLKTRERIR